MAPWQGTISKFLFEQIWVRVDPFLSYMVPLMGVANIAWWCGVLANVWLLLKFFCDLAHLHMQIRGIKPKNPTGFSLSEVGPTSVVNHRVGGFLIYWRPWAGSNLLQHPKNGILGNSSKRLPEGLQYRKVIWVHFFMCARNNLIGSQSRSYGQFVTLN